MQQARVVVAVSPGLRQRMRAIVPECELRFVETGDDLLRELDDERCDMLILGAHFDESSAVTALERVLARRETFPVVCVRGIHSRLGYRSIHALRMALDALGAREFIDLLLYPDDEAGNARVRALLERLMSRLMSRE
jgi:hypothetical protein